MTSGTQKICMRVNGTEHHLEVAPDRLLIDTLRDDLQLTGTKESCSIGVCGACSVLIDGRLQTACLTLTVRVHNRDVTTIEGLMQEEKLDPVQKSFIDRGGLQCGFCTPGMVIAARALLNENPLPSRDEITDWMLGNLCRCTGYYKIIESIEHAAQALAAEKH